MILAIIPARGGSKGIPRKNLQPVAGVPLIAHTIRHAVEAALVDRVVVSTDDDEIAAVSAARGVEVIRRPPEISGDTASSESALLHVLGALAKRAEDVPELVVFLQATSPLRRPADVDAAVELCRSGEYDSLFSASPAHGFVWEIRDDGAMPLTYEPAARPMRQQIGKRVMENGSIYVFKPRVLEQTGVRLGGRIGVYRMGFLEALQIDDPEDLVLANRILDSWSREASGARSTLPVER